MKKYNFFYAYFLLLVLVIIGCSDEATVTPEDLTDYNNADGINGGKLYDKFWASETNFNQSDTNISKFNAFSDFFRCKQCHGWDLLGTKGAYINRGPKKTRPNIATNDLLALAKNESPLKLFNLIKNGSDPSKRRSVNEDLSTYDPQSNSTTGDKMPDYSKILTDAQIWDIVKFLKVEKFNINDLCDFSITGTYPTGSFTFANIGKDGNAETGLSFYNNNCIDCHGADGKMILVDNNTYTVGSFIRQKANEAQHKIKFGQLGSKMKSVQITLQQMKDLYKALADEGKFPNP